VVETGLLSLAIPFLSEKRILGMAGIHADAVAFFEERSRNSRPLFIGATHLAYWEGLPWLPLLLRPVPIGELVGVFRPLRDPALDAWVKASRERFGAKLLSRRSGLHASLHTLKHKGCVSILFDQSAGSHGYLTLFFGRECSTTPLPGMLVERTDADCCVLYARRLDFWRFRIELVHVPTDKTAQGVTIALNRALEKILRDDEDLCASWLWMHQRWRILDRPGEKQKLEAKRGGLIG
jgi:lauroyl/myristoyl acyltransferase